LRSSAVGWSQGGHRFSTREPIRSTDDRPTVVPVRQDHELRPRAISPVFGVRSLLVRELLQNGVSLIIVLQTLTNLGPLTVSSRVLAVGLTVAVIGLWTMIVRRRQGDLVDQLALLAVVGFGCWLNVLLPDAGQVYPAAYATLFVAPFFYGMPEAAVPATAAVAAVTFSTMFVGHLDVVAGLGNGAGAAFFGVAAMFWGRVLRTSQQNAALLEEVQHSREAEQRSAVVAERGRLARELHDVLAHTLSSLALHLESTRVLAVSRDVDDDIVQRIDRGVALARTGLEEARDAVGTLRDAALPGPERLADLVEVFSRTSGISCRLEERGVPLELAPDAQVALYRSAQEALTNVAKHARATSVDVCLSWYDDAVTLRVVDDGLGARPVSTLAGGGNGLRGMRERAELAGGELRAGPADTGFVVELKLPA
jgi:signal transduction histidine kinase